ncbi:MAG: hypothetical protein AB8H47_03290 [Bacteroidia bacterium]
MSLSLNEINQALKPYQREVRQQYALEQNISALQHQLASHHENLKYLDQALAKEWDDVKELTESRWREFWMSLKLTESEDVALKKEQKEWEIVRDERQNLISLIAQVEEQVKTLQAKQQYLGKLDTPLEDLLATKHKLLMDSPTHDVYQGMVAKEQSVQAHARSVEKLVADFIMLIDYLQKLEAMLQTSSGRTNNHRSISYYLDHADELLQQLATQLLSTDLELDLDPTVLQGFEKQLNASKKAPAWIETIDTFQGNAQIYLTQLQSKETLIASELETISKRRQKFLFESY